uniref:IMPDH domain-containing protein n=1 Tax=Heterorhabditis bacteriophora TaxID=37862 RepID=A0A1I7X4F5_HETBA
MANVTIIPTTAFLRRDVILMTSVIADTQVIPATTAVI